jgi:hypothetical protein
MSLGAVGYRRMSVATLVTRITKHRTQEDPDAAV